MKYKLFTIAMVVSASYVALSVHNPSMADAIQPEDPPYFLCENVPISAFGDSADIERQIEEQGYAIINIRIEKGCWEVKALDANQQVYEFYAHPITRKIVHMKQKP